MVLFEAIVIFICAFALLMVLLELKDRIDFYKVYRNGSSQILWFRAAFALVLGLICFLVYVGGDLLLTFLGLSL